MDRAGCWSLGERAAVKAVKDSLVQSRMVPVWRLGCHGQVRDRDRRRRGNGNCSTNPKLFFLVSCSINMLSGYGTEPLSDDILKRSLTAFSTPTRQEGLKEEGARRIATIIQSCPVTPTEKYRRYMPTTNPAQASCKRDHAYGMVVACVGTPSRRPLKWSSICFLVASIRPREEPVGKPHLAQTHVSRCVTGRALRNQQWRTVGLQMTGGEATVWSS